MKRTRPFSAVAIVRFANGGSRFVASSCKHSGSGDCPSKAKRVPGRESLAERNEANPTIQRSRHRTVREWRVAICASSCKRPNSKTPNAKPQPLRHDGDGDEACCLVCSSLRGFLDHKLPAGGCGFARTLRVRSEESIQENTVKLFSMGNHWCVGSVRRNWSWRMRVANKRLSSRIKK
jgi:hypothetical protein